MGTDKISLTLFDILSYLLPGYVILFAFSIVEATFFDSGLLALAELNGNWLTSTVIAYFLGHFSHRIASFIKNQRPKWFSNPKQRLMTSLYNRSKDLLVEMHSVQLKEDERIGSLETYLLADNYIVASGKIAERDSLITREGFHKTSMVAFAIVTITILASLFSGGMKLQLTVGDYFSLSFLASIIGFMLFLIITIVFWRGFVFFNRLKINNILLLAMTLRALDKEKLGL